MARIPITIYKNSVLASLLSIFGWIFALSGITIAWEGEVVDGILLMLAGVGFIFLAPVISDNKQFRAWKAKIEADYPLVNHIKEDTNFAIFVYNRNPGKKTLAFISQLNPTAGQLISQKINEQKAKTQ